MCSVQVPGLIQVNRLTYSLFLTPRQSNAVGRKFEYNVVGER